MVKKELGDLPAHRFTKRLHQALPKTFKFLEVIKIGIVENFEINRLGHFVKLQAKFEIGRILDIIIILRKEFEACKVIGAMRNLLRFVLLIIPEKSVSLIRIVNVH